MHVLGAITKRLTLEESQSCLLEYVDFHSHLETSDTTLN